MNFIKLSALDTGLALVENCPQSHSQSSEPVTNSSYSLNLHLSPPSCQIPPEIVPSTAIPSMVFYSTV
jgi:hypothetical protein